MRMLVWVFFTISCLTTSNIRRDIHRRHTRPDGCWVQRSVEQVIGMQSMQGPMFHVTLTLTPCELSTLLTWNITCHAGKDLEIKKLVTFTRN